jgi:nitrite reductase (NO-forming)
MACHQENGKGIPGSFPPLAQSDFLNTDKTRAIKTVIGGKEGLLTVNGAKYDGSMPAWTLSDEDIANVLSYAYGSWDNSRKEVTPADVKATRGELTSAKPQKP